MFSKGQSFGQYPLRVVYMPMEERRSEFPAQLTVSVPRKKFPRAVDRNHIRRRVREAWRLNKHRLYRALENREQQYALLIIYVAREALPYPEIEGAVRQMIRRLVKKL